MGRFKDRIDTRFKAQEQKGVLRYGQVLEQNHGSLEYRLEHLAQELTDSLMYVEWLKEGGQILAEMFELLVQDLEAKELCPIDAPCDPDNLPEGGCIACLRAHYEKKAREKFGI